MIVGDEFPVVNFERIITDLRRDPQNVVRTVPAGIDMACFDVGENLRRVRAE
jgi:hypothetical protein